MSEGLVVVLSEPHSVDDTHSFLVGSVKHSERPLLVTSGNQPRKGQVLDLKTTASGSVDFSVVEFDDAETRRLQEHYTALNPAVVDKSDWSAAVLQEFYPLESLVPLDSNAQLVLHNTMRNRPEELLLIGFADLPPLSYRDYTRLCARFKRQPVPACVAVPAAGKLRELESLYAQGVELRVGELEDIDRACVELLIDRAGLCCNDAILSWPWTVTVERRLAERIHILENLPGCSWISDNLSSDIVPHVTSRALTVLDCIDPAVVDILRPHYTVVDFADADDCETVCRRLVNDQMLLLVSTHLASPSTLLAIFQNHTPINTLIFLDRAYNTPTRQHLPDHGSVGARPKPLYDFPNADYPDLHMFNETESFLELYKSQYIDSVLVVSTLEDVLRLECTLDTRLRAMQLDDPLCTPLGISFDWGDRVDVSVMGKNTCSLYDNGISVPTTATYCKSALVRADVLRIGQLRKTYGAVFFYTQTELDCDDLYRLAAHTSAKLAICAPDHALAAL